MYPHIRVDRHPLLQFMDGATFGSPVDTAHLIKCFHKVSPWNQEPQR